MKNLMRKKSPKQAAKPAPIPELPAKQQADMNKIMQVLKPAVQADPERFLRQEHSYNVYAYKAMAGSTVEEHLEPIFWLQLANKLNPLDEIVVKEELGQWRALFLVRSISGDGVDVILLNETSIGGVQAIGGKPKLKDGLHIEYTGNHTLWAVYDGEKQLAANIQNQQAAENWLANNDPYRPTA